jgi:hypothetical protein
MLIGLIVIVALGTIGYIIDKQADKLWDETVGKTMEFFNKEEK